MTFTTGTGLLKIDVFSFMLMLEVKLVTAPEEINAIKELQNLNLRPNISDEEAASQGFLTASYTLEYL
ncbi:MAG: hypothetical protein RLZZ42_1408, partial [Bacteroidota bacterium]